VTAESVRKSRQAVRRARKTEPGALIAVCGCYSQLAPMVAEALGADLVGGSGQRLEFALEVERRVSDKAPSTCHYDSAPRPFDMLFEELPPVGCEAARTRALLKIQDGCDNFCAYCIVPFARGCARSLPIGRASEQARRLGEQGFREIVVTGIEISSYGKDLTGNGGLHPALTDVVREICCAAPLARVRLGSLDPGALSEEFCLKLREIPNICDHFHLSLQSGCDDTLRRMGRKYHTVDVLESVATLRRLFPGCGITADLIAGFPGESEAEFEETLAFIKRARFSQMHIFPFSSRPGTRAEAMPEQVEKSVKIRRARVAAAVAAEMSRDFILEQTGKIVQVLLEHRRGGFWIGHSGNYIEVTVKNGEGKNRMCPVRIKGLENGKAWGEVEGFD